MDEPTHLPPIQPSKIVCVHLNYESRRAEFLAELGPAPTFFHKPTTSLNAHGGEVVRPARCRYLNYEGEIAIVIGRTCRHIAPDEAADHIAGYTIANDYGLHYFRDKRIRTLVNGDVRQDGSTDEMMWDMHYLVADIARTITLHPGDLLLSGTPAISRTVYPGDVVEVEVEGLGTLRNQIVEGPTPIRSDVGAQPTESEEVLSTAQGGDWEFRGVRKPDLSQTR